MNCRGRQGLPCDKSKAAADKKTMKSFVCPLRIRQEAKGLSYSKGDPGTSLGQVFQQQEESLLWQGLPEEGCPISVTGGF